jgi:rod shape-determining protein MreC
MVGTVAQIIPDPSTNFYVLKIKTAANFQNLQQVMLVENIQEAEQRQLNIETKKIIEDAKKNKR